MVLRKKQTDYLFRSTYLCFPVFLIVAFNLFYCNQRNINSDETISALHNISLEKLDSVTIHFLGEYSVQDIDPISKTVLFTDFLPHSVEIHLADFNGNIFQNFSKFGDMPDSYGVRMAPIRLIDNRKFLVYGSNGFMTYDFDGNLVSQVKLEDFEMPGRTGGGLTFGMERLQNQFLMMNFGFPHNKDFSDIKIYENMYLLDLLYPETGKKEPIIQFPETSIFRTGKHFFRSAWDPTFTIADNLIYIVFGLEPVIYAFENSPPYSLVSSIPLDLPEYRYFKGTAGYTEEGNSLLFRFYSAFIENIVKFDEYFVIGYFPGYDNMDLAESKTNKSPDEWVIFREKIKKKYPYRVAIIDSSGKIMNDFVPENLDPRGMVVRNGELWTIELPNEEVEEDYFRIYRVGLKKGEK